MRTKKSRTFILFALAAVVVLALSCFFITACDDDEKVETYKIEWKIDDKASVKIAGSETLPSEWIKDSELAFTVSAPDGYNISVKAYSLLSAKDGAYKFTVNRDVTVTVTLSKVLDGITVTGFDADVQYYDEDTIPLTAFTVTANYKLGDEVVTSGISITYQNGQKLTTGDTRFTVNFGGKTAEITLNKKVISPYTFNTAELILEDDVPVIVVNGVYNASGDAATAEEGVVGYIHDAMERGTWVTKEFKAEAKAEEDKTFVLKLTVLGITPGHQYFFHIKDGSDNSNFTCPEILNESVIIGNKNEDIYSGTIFDDSKALTDTKGAKYYIGFCEDWNPTTLMIHYEWKDAPKFSNASLEAKDGKPYLVFNGTGKVTETSLLEFINHLDLEDVSSNNAKLADYVNDGAVAYEGGIILEIDAENGTFKVCLLLQDKTEDGSVVKDGANFFAHLGMKNGDYYPNVGLTPADANQSITCNGLTFSFTDADKIGLTQDWQKGLLYINVAAAQEAGQE